MITFVKTITDLPLENGYYLLGIKFSSGLTDTIAVSFNRDKLYFRDLADGFRIQIEVQERLKFYFPSNTNIEILEICWDEVPNLYEDTNSTK